MKTSRRRFLSGVATVGSLSIISRGLRNNENYVSSNETRIIGHRGYSYEEKDNSLPAFKRAYKEGADGVEMDVRITSDDEIILNHDPYIIGTNDIYYIPHTDYKEIKDKTLHINEFMEWYSRTEPSFELFVDFKDTNSLSRMVKILDDYNVSNRCVLISLFESNIKNAPSNYETGLVGTIGSQRFLERYNELNADYSLPYHIPTINNNRDYLNEIDGYWLLTEDKYDFKEVLNREPEIIITNRPSLVKEI